MSTKARAFPTDTNTYLINSFGGGGARVSLYKIDTSNVMHGAQASAPAHTVATPASQPSAAL